MGNTTFDGRYTYVYDELNRLVRVEQDGALVAVYGFDASNRRIVKTVGSTTTHYLYDTESNLIAEATADGTISREYLYLDGELIAINDYQDNPGLYYAINDHLGTPQQLIQADGTIVWQAAYLPFGSAQVTVEQVVNNIRFPGQYYDQETGLHYNWHRFYDPEAGRYISADPIGLAGGMNLYVYVGGDPVNDVDPLGLMMGLFGDYYFGGKPFNPWHFPRGPKGPFGEICGMKTTLLATWIPDITPGACQRHDDCYDDCAKNCEGYDCKKNCDDELLGSNRPYGYATHMFGKEAYDIARRKYDCDECVEQ